MLIPCIDLQSGRAVQLVHGRKRRLAVDDVRGSARYRFGGYPLSHVIDLDAAMRKGSNSNGLSSNSVREAVRKRGMRVCALGGGIRHGAAHNAANDRGLGARRKLLVGSAAFRNGRVNTGIS